MTIHNSHCTNCGVSIVDGLDFCPGCGQALTSGVGYRIANLGGQGPALVPWTIGQIALALFLFIAVLFAAAFTARAVGPLYAKYETALETWVAVHLLAIGTVLVVWFMGLRFAPDPFNALGLVRPRTSWRMTAALAIAALVFSMVATFVYGYAVDFLGLDSLRPPEIRTDAIFPGLGILFTLQALALVTPISEEVLFRGYVLRGLLARIGPGPAVVSTALVFSALHFDPGTIIPIFFTGLALGWLNVKTGSLWPCFAAHAGQNAIALLAVRAGL